MPPVSPAVRSDFAPTGTMRVGINHGNLVLAQKNPTTGEVTNAFMWKQLAAMMGGLVAALFYLGVVGVDRL